MKSLNSPNFVGFILKMIKECDNGDSWLFANSRTLANACSSLNMVLVTSAIDFLYLVARMRLGGDEYQEGEWVWDADWKRG